LAQAILAQEDEIMADAAELDIFVDNDKRFAVEFLRLEDYEEVHRLQVDVFIEQNLETQGAKVSKWAWGEFSAWLNADWDKVGLTQIVRDRKADNQVVAFLFCKETEFPDGPFVSNWDAITKDSPGLKRMVEHGSAVFNKSSRIACPIPCLSIETGGTRKGYEGLGLAKFLRQRLCELAKEKGFRRIKVETSSMGTRHIYKDLLGFETLAESRYVDWQAPDGSFPFRDGNFKMPDDFIFTCQHKLLEQLAVDVDAASESIVVSGAGCDEVNGTYVRLLGSRGPDSSTVDCWMHAVRVNIFMANIDVAAAGHAERNAWVLYRNKGACYFKPTPHVTEKTPPSGQWELAPWAPLLGGVPGEPPAPHITYSSERRKLVIRRLSALAAAMMVLLLLLRRRLLLRPPPRRI